MISIKKYSNRRLYNTDSSSYITQVDILDLIKKNIPFKVIDTEKIDITSSILMQIILEKQTIGTNLIPEELLKKIILFNESNQAADMFGFLSNVLNFANLSGIFTKGFPGISKLKNIDFSTYELPRQCFFLICFATPDLQNHMNRPRNNTKQNQKVKKLINHHFKSVRF